jgi:two-component system, OmpR family, sensor kinase
MKRIRRLSAPRAPGIRWQITLWYTAVFTLLLVLVGVVSYGNTSASLGTNIDSTLALRARQIAAGIGLVNGQFVIEDVAGALPGLGATGSPASSTPTRTSTSTPAAGATPAPTRSASGTPTHNASGTPTAHSDDSHESGDDSSGDDSDEQREKASLSVDTGDLVRILGSGGTVMYYSPASGKLPPEPGATSRAKGGVPWYSTVTSAGGQPVRVYNYPLSHNHLVFGLVEVGASLQSVEQTLHDLLLGWLLITPLVLLLGALGSLWLARRALRPVGRLTRIARQVEAGDLQQRVPVPGAHDEIQELALTLNDMIARLDSTFSRQRRFVADASHELRTPVSAIRSMTDVALLNEKSPADYVGVLWGINAEAERLGRLISDLLVLARDDEAQTPLERAPLRLDLIAHDVASVSAVLANERHIQLRVETSGPVVVLGDSDRILQAVLNLIQNALTYTPAGRRGLVTIRVTDDGIRAILSVTDNGIGIEPGHLPHIFERFYRASPDSAHSQGGSGLGLSIVDWVVGAHDGEVTVQSQVGKGSTFTIYLPLAGTFPSLPVVRERSLVGGKKG